VLSGSVKVPSTAWPMQVKPRQRIYPYANRKAPWLIAGIHRSANNHKPWSRLTITRHMARLILFRITILVVAKGANPGCFLHVSFLGFALLLHTSSGDFHANSLKIPNNL
jgi:hypothetical protein